MSATLHVPLKQVGGGWRHLVSAVSKDRTLTQPQQACCACPSKSNFNLKKKKRLLFQPPSLWYLLQQPSLTHTTSTCKQASPLTRRLNSWIPLSICSLRMHPASHRADGRLTSVKPCQVPHEAGGPLVELHGTTCSHPSWLPR